MSTSAKISWRLAIMAVLAIALLASSLAYPGTAEAWLAIGKHKQYPSAGGTWYYGVFDGKARSNYIVRFSHGSTVRVNDRQHRSICTAPNHLSKASLYAINSPGADDRYFYRLC